MTNTGRNAQAPCIQRVVIVGDESSGGGGDFEPQCFTDDSGTVFFGIWQLVDDVLTLEFFTVDANGDTTPYEPTSDPIPCAPEGAKHITTGYVEVCRAFDIELPINGEGTFSDALGATTTISAEPGVSSLIRSQIERAQIYEAEEINKGLPVTNFVINTDGGDTFEFPPSALVDGAGTLVFTTADVVTWPGPLTDTITSIEYSVLDDCGCQSVEMVQQIDPDDNVTLLGVYLPEFTDENGVKRQLDIPLGFGTSGPFAGPCPDEEQVLSVVDLCCNDDLEEGSPEIAAQRTVWADGSDTATMRNNGVPISGNDGDVVDEIQDKLDPGVAPSTVTQPTFGDPLFRTNSFNGLSSLEFDGVDDRMELDLGARPVNQTFTLFYLVSTTDIVNGTACLLSVGTTGGGQLAGTPNTWQLSRQGFEDVLVFRGVGAATTGIGNQQPMFTPVTENVNCPLCQGAQLGIDIGLATWTEFADGQLHLITLNYDGNRFTGYFDGQLRFEADVLPDGSFPLSEYFRYAGNRINDSFIAMNLAEHFISAQQLTPEETTTVNAYLICKWGIDPSLAAGGAGDLVLGPDGAFDSPSPFRQITKASGEVVYLNLNNGLEFPVPQVPGLATCDIDDSCCIVMWDECLQYSTGSAGTIGGILAGTWTSVNPQRVRKVLAADTNGVVYTLDFTVDAPNTCGQFNLGDMAIIQFNGTTTVNVTVDISPAYTGPLDWLIREFDGPATETYQNFSILNPDNVDAGLNFGPAGAVTADAANTDGDINWNNVTGVSQITFDYVRDNTNNSVWMDFELYDVTLDNIQTTQFRRVFIKDIVSDVTRFQDHDITTGADIEIPEDATIVQCPEAGGIDAATDSFADQMYSAGTDEPVPPENMDVNTKFGSSAVITTASVPVDVWSTLSLYTGHPTGAVEPVEFFSSSAADTMTVVFSGLDALGAPQQESVVMNGVTPVASALTWLRMNRAVVTGPTSNAGTITARNTVTTANVFVSLPAGQTQTRIGADTVPTGKRMAITAFNISAGRDNGADFSCTVSVMVRPDGETYRAIRTYSLGSGFAIAQHLDVPIVLDPLTDIVARVESVSDQNVTVSFDMSYFLFDA